MVNVAWQRARRLPPALTAAGLALLWLMLAPRTPDLAAAVYRTLLVARNGLQVYDDSWFGGHHIPGYSLTFPVIASVIGVRVTGVVAACASTVLFERLATPRWGAAARPGVALFALGAVADLFIGRLTFSLGVTAALGALVALDREQPLPAWGAAALCAATSPVAGLFLALAALAAWLADRTRRTALILAGVACGVVIVLALVFPEGGVEPCPPFTLISVVGFSLVLARAIGPGERTIQIGCALYAVAGVASFVLPTPMGSNVSRLGPEVAPALVATVIAASGGRLPALSRRWSIVLLAGVLGWQWFAPAREMFKTTGDPSYGQSYYAPLLAALQREGAGNARIEIPFTRGHWEAVFVADRYALARGWETQLDEKYNHLFFVPGLTAAAYHRWLVANSVAWVAVPDAPLDPTGKREARLIRRHQPDYLSLAWSGAHWKLYRVRAAAPLAGGGGRLVSLHSSDFTVAAAGPGTTVVRLHWTPYWSVSGPACVVRTPVGWTEVVASRPGPIRVTASFSLAGLAGRTRVCPDPR